MVVRHLVVKPEPVPFPLPRIAFTAVLAAVAGASQTPQTLCAQESTSAEPARFLSAEPAMQSATAKPRLFAYDPSKTDLSLGLTAQLSATRTTDTTQPATTGLTGPVLTEQTYSTSPSLALVAGFHQQFSTWLGYTVNLGYSKFTIDHSTGVENGSTPGPSSSFDKTSHRTHLFEISTAYVVKGPASSHRLQTFAELGGGALIFDQEESEFFSKTNFRPAALFGAGVDYRLSDHLGLRAEYRGFLALTPDNQVAKPVFTVVSEPAISLKYTFGAHKKMQ